MPRRTSETNRPLGQHAANFGPQLPSDLPGDLPSGSSSPGDTPAPSGDAAKPRVLVLTPRRAVARRVKLALGGAAESITFARSASELTPDASNPSDHDLLILDSAIGLADARLAGETIKPGVLVAIEDRPTLEGTVAWMRLGASDVLTAGDGRDALRERLSDAARRAAELRSQSNEAARLKRLCKHMHRAHNEVSGQVSDLCSDMVAAYADLNEQMSETVLATELNGLLRQELDVESVLRTLLEFLLAKIGTTNAAIFLPSSNGDFGRGAYINYDCPRDTAEPLMDQLASIVAPAFEETRDVQRFLGEDELRSVLGEDAHWMGDVAASAVGCRQDEECLAVLVLFRSTARPFDAEHARVLQTASRLFAAQLARVIRVHHRHLPEEEWGGFEAEEGEDWGMAA